MRNLILLHGALGSAAQLDELSSLLENDYECHNLNFSGHGGAPMPDSFSIPLFANDVFRYMESHQIEKSDFFGYSMGGYVALYLAANHREKVDKIMTLATKFAWSHEIALKEVGMLDPEKIEQKIPAFAEILETRHAPNNWKNVLSKTAAMMVEMGEKPPLGDADLRSIPNPVLLCRGELDAMVSADETQHVHDLLLDSKLITIPSTEHPFEKVDFNKISEIITAFLS